MMGRGELLHQGTIKELTKDLEGEVWEAVVPGRMLAQIEEWRLQFSILSASIHPVQIVLDRRLPECRLY
ncbi:hypothetical protein [Paenibacillus sp. B-A-8]|uniref:hypothetical protein n=1 Tax=Paenibacillus sp. B-A-8 TaxID=3400419 RepID=UPI003B017FB2